MIQANTGSDNRSSLPPQSRRRLRQQYLLCTDPEEYRQHGLGPLPADANGRSLYLDLVKRAVCNILYEDLPDIFYDHNRRPMLATDFDLTRRVWGEDLPSAAHTMVGVKRLENVQHCIEEILREKVPGDLVEAGVMCGGAAVFMRACLKAYNITDRRVFACDAFVPPRPPIPFLLRLLGRTVLFTLASIPNRLWQRWLFFRCQALQGDYRAFPDCEDPSDDLIHFTMWMLRHPSVAFRRRATGLNNVCSHFARYGLLDDQVVLLQGFFSETLPKAPLRDVAVLRLDGDTFEGTMDVMNLLYPKLASGGFCIIDDYHSFSDCRRAVDLYRDEHKIKDKMEPIDNLAVFWRKS